MPRYEVLKPLDHNNVRYDIGGAAPIDDEDTADSLEELGVIGAALPDEPVKKGKKASDPAPAQQPAAGTDSQPSGATQTESPPDA